MTQWMRSTTRQALLERARRVAAETGRPLCVYHEMSDCNGQLTLEHVIARSEWDRLARAALDGSVVAARRLAYLTQEYGSKNSKRNLVVACISHNASRRDLPVEQFAPPATIRLITRERQAPLAA